MIQSIGYDYPVDSKYVSVAKTLLRRKQGTEIALTFYRSGYDIFSDSLVALDAPCSYLSSMALRRNTQTPCNIFGGARFAGIGRNYGNTYLCYYIDEGRIYYTNERRFFMSAVSKTQCTSSVIYFGKSYNQIANIVLKKPVDTQKKKNNLLSFYEVYRKSTLPVHLVECSDVGAMQLLLMGQEHYRIHIAKLALGEQFAPPYQFVNSGDASFKGGEHLPVTIGIDMDIKHIRAVHKGAKEHAHNTIAVVAFKEQLPALEKLCASFKPKLYGIDSKETLLAFGLTLQEQTKVPYLTQKGEYINVPIIKKD